MTAPKLDSAPLVLVAEDEDIVRQMVVRCLAYEGYNVLTASDGMAALAVLQTLGGPVDVLVTDIRMPRLSGDQLGRMALDAGLARRVLFMTGYADHPAATSALGPIIKKPFHPDALCEAVKAALHRETPGVPH